MKQRKTKNQQEYQKQLNRLLRAQKQYEKKGIRFELPAFVTQKPNRITKRYLSELKAIKPKNLIEQKFKPSTRDYIRQIEKRQERKAHGLSFSSITKQPKEIKKNELSETDTIDYSKIPVFSYVQAVRKRLLELYETQSFVQAPVRKNEILAIFEDTVTFYDAAKDKLEKYLKEHQKRISELCSIITYDSDTQNVNASFIELAEILNVSALTDDQRERVSDMAEMIND